MTIKTLEEAKTMLEGYSWVHEMEDASRLISPQDLANVAEAAGFLSGLEWQKIQNKEEIERLTHSNNYLTQLSKDLLVEIEGLKAERLRGEVGG